MSGVSPDRLMAAMAEAMKLRDEIGDDDQKLLHDVIDGQTNAFGILDKLAAQAVADRLLVERGEQRLKRIGARADRARDTIKRMMDALGLTRLERDLVTITVSDGPRGVRVTDETAIPDAYIRRSVDKQALGKDLRAGATVEGAELANGQPVLKILSR